MSKLSARKTSVTPFECDKKNHSESHDPTNNNEVYSRTKVEMSIRREQELGIVPLKVFHLMSILDFIETGSSSDICEEK